MARLDIERVFALVRGGLARLGTLALLLVFSACASDFSEEYITDVWTADDGLPDSSVTAITQTPDGYLWIGTYNGLVRFDGVRFVTFDPGNTPALAHARVRKLSVDNQGTLWINTFDGSMSSLRQGVFAREWTQEPGLDPDAVLVSSGSNEVTFLLHRGLLRRRPQSAPAGAGWEELSPTNRSVGALCLADGAGTIWYRDSNRHLLRVNGDGFAALPEACGLADDEINCLATDSNGRLWVGTDKEIALWDGTRFQNATPTNAELPGPVMFLSVGQTGGVWVGTGGSVWRSINRQWTVEAQSLRGVFTNSLVRGEMLRDHHGGAWLYDYGLGLWHIAADGRVRHVGSQEGFPGERVNCMFEDHEGNWWVGLDAGGLVRIRERRFQIVDPGGQLSARPARSVCQETNGSIWIGTLGEGLARWQAGSLTDLAMPGGTGKGFVFCVCPDRAGRLWVSAGDEDLYVRENGRFDRVTPLIHGVKVIFTARSGRVWVGTKSGLYFSDAYPEHAFQQQEGVRRHDVRALSEDGSGNLWAGTDDGSLFRIAGNAVETLHPPGGKASQAIWSLLAEPDGTVWVGTFRGGLLRLRDGKFTRFGPDEGMSDVICQILSDDAGNLWLGSHQGIFRVAESALDRFARGVTNFIPLTDFGRSDGLPSLECSGGYQPSAWRAHDGRLWFTTVKGAVSVQPRDIRPNRIAPAVVIEDVLIDGKDVDAEGLPAERSTPSETEDRMIFDRGRKLLQVPPGKHQIEFRYTGLSLVSPGRVQFRYRLENADADWVDARTRRSVQYNLLPAGTYQFRVTACNSDGVWNDAGAALRLRILPHFYETWWFRLLAIVGILGTAGFAVRNISVRRLRREMEQLERRHAIERERARIARDIHDDLGASLNLIAVLGDLAKKEKTDERIEKMSTTARQAVTSLDEIVWAVNPRNDTLAHLVDYTGQFATGYLRAAGVRCLLDVPEELPPCQVPSDVRHNLFLVIKEALQNIVKHAHATEVWLRISTGAEKLRVAIEDNGRGFEKVAGNTCEDGLSNMRERVSEIHGQCRVKSQVGAGTRVEIEIPWQNS